ncbi:unnamed protein product [Adineta steineri]|uniref:Uncharacterized protein n=1 Tax=Adineta steineri TaxID=433720 RepID=A0A814KS29_9BILA|nr:unnamed protein product [Adineta steineri]CAF1053570.1 unnamed protein product [Adineta steineri]CAF1120775.1 unnamed protein product [Adineta steineri]
MTALELAAQNTKEEAANYILNIEDLIDVTERIEALELSGASLVYNVRKAYSFEKAYEYLICKQYNIKSIKICVSPIELESIRYDPETLRVEALLILECLLLPTSCIKLIDSIWDEGWEYADKYQYDHSIYLWLYGLELSIINDDVNMNVSNLKDRMMYIFTGIRELDEIYVRCYQWNTRSFQRQYL